VHTFYQFPWITLYVVLHFLTAVVLMTVPVVALKALIAELHTLTYVIVHSATTVVLKPVTDDFFYSTFFCNFCTGVCNFCGVQILNEVSPCVAVLRTLANTGVNNQYSGQKISGNLINC
jgi:hypothetical protein